MDRFREPVNGFTHLAGAVLAAFALIWMIGLTQDNTTKMISFAIYGCSMILLYSASAAYHLSNGSERKILWLRRFDHAAIYLLIAGTYTPIFYNFLSGSWRWWMLGLIWCLSLIGAFYKLFFLHHAGHLSLLSYIMLGSLGIIVLPQALAALPPGTGIFVFASGVLYIIGVVVYGLQRPNFNHLGHHEIWHLLVLGGSTLQFLALARFLLNG